MAFFKDFLETLRLSDDDDFDVDDYDDYREAELEKERKKEAKAKKKAEAKARQLEEDDEEFDEEPETERKPLFRRPSFSKPAPVAKSAPIEPVESKPATRAGFRFAQQNRSVEEPANTYSAPVQQPAAPARPVRPSVPRSTTHSLREVRIMRPTTFEDSQDICDALLSGKPIIVNLENFDMDMAQRVMDFVCGCLYSIDGKLHQISGYIFIVSPDDVDISGDYLALMRQDGFGVPTFNRKL